MSAGSQSTFSMCARISPSFSMMAATTSMVFIRVLLRFLCDFTFDRSLKGRASKDLSAISSHSAHGNGASGGRLLLLGLRTFKVSSTGWGAGVGRRVPDGGCGCPRRCAAHIIPLIQQEEPPKRLFLRVGLPSRSDGDSWGDLRRLVASRHASRRLRRIAYGRRFRFLRSSSTSDMP